MDLPLAGGGETLDSAWENIWTDYVWNPWYGNLWRQPVMLRNILTLINAYAMRCRAFLIGHVKSTFGTTTFYVPRSYTEHIGDIVLIIQIMDKELYRALTSGSSRFYFYRANRNVQYSTSNAYCLSSHDVKDDGTTIMFIVTTLFAETLMKDGIPTNEFERADLICRSTEMAIDWVEKQHNHIVVKEGLKEQ